VAPLKISVATVAIVVVLVASTVTTAYHLRNVFGRLHMRALPEYMDEDLAVAIEWMGRHANESAVVLSSPEVAPYVPVLANNRMFTGNYEAPTSGFPEKLQRIHWLVNASIPKSNPEITGFLRDNRIEYVFFDEYLYRLGGDAAQQRLEVVPDLALVFRNKAVSIYRLRPSEL